MNDRWAPDPEFLAKLDKQFEGADQMSEKARRKRVANANGDDYRVLVTGSRDWDDRDTIYKALYAFDDAPHVTLVHGDCRGADRIAAEFAEQMGWTVEPHPAKWELFGNQAGYIRNDEMVKLGANICLAFNKNMSKGAGGCAALAEGAGIKVILHEMRTPVFTNSEMFRVACTAIVFNREGKMLITRRAYSKKQWPGKWTVPGGGLQTDDFTELEPTYSEGQSTQWYGVVENGVRREVRKETGLEISKPWLVTDLAFIREDNIPVVVFSYAADLMGPESIRYDEDTIAHAWVDLEEANSYDLIEGIYEELKMAKKRWNAMDDVARAAGAYDDGFNE